MQRLQQDGFKLVIFTNQALIRGDLSGRLATEFRAKVDSILVAAGVSASVFVATQKDCNRKPHAGMWKLFEECNGQQDLTVAPESFYCGDAAGREQDHSADDKNFAVAVGLPFKLPEDMFVDG